MCLLTFKSILCLQAKLSTISIEKLLMQEKCASSALLPSHKLMECEYYAISKPQNPSSQYDPLFSANALRLSIRLYQEMENFIQCKTEDREQEVIYAEMTHISQYIPVRICIFCAITIKNNMIWQKTDVESLKSACDCSHTSSSIALKNTLVAHIILLQGTSRPLSLIYHNIRVEVSINGVSVRLYILKGSPCINICYSACVLGI